MFDAVVTYLVEVGYSAMRVDEIARRCRIGKATMYRRWSSKAELVIAAASHFARAAPGFAPSADIRANLLGYCAWMTSSAGARRLDVVRALRVGALHDADLARGLAEQNADDLLLDGASVAAMLERAKAREESPSRLDTDMIQEVIVGTWLVRRHLRATAMDEHAIHRLVDDVLLRSLNASGGSVPTSARPYVDSHRQEVASE